MSNEKLAEALRNARSFVSLFHDDPAQVCVTEIDEALQAHAAEAAQRPSAEWFDQRLHENLLPRKAEAAQAQAQSSEWVMVPREPTKAMIEASCKIKLGRLEALRDGHGASSGVASAVREEWDAMLAAAPQQAAEPVAWPFVDSPGEIADRLKQALENGCPLLGAVRQVFIENPPLYTHPQPAQDAKDAARYRELRDGDNDLYVAKEGKEGYAPEVFLGPDLDAELDATMTKESRR